MRPFADRYVSALSSPVHLALPNYGSSECVEFVSIA